MFSSVEICQIGHYYDKVERRCTSCKLGFYQGSPGELRCVPCPNGLTTNFTQSTDVTDCTYPCRLGSEYSVEGTCSPCVKGTYRETQDQVGCLTCPYGYTTETSGAYKASLCSVGESKTRFFFNQNCHSHCKI